MGEKKWNLVSIFCFFNFFFFLLKLPYVLACARLGRSTAARSRRHSTARFRSAKSASSSGSEGNDSSNEPNSLRHMGTGKAFFCKLRIFNHQTSHKASHARGFRKTSLPRKAPWSRFEKSKSSLHLDIDIYKGLPREAFLPSKIPKLWRLFSKGIRSSSAGT